MDRWIEAKAKVNAQARGNGGIVYHRRRTLDPSIPYPYAYAYMHIKREREKKI